HAPENCPRVLFDGIANRGGVSSPAPVAVDPVQIVPLEDDGDDVPVFPAEPAHGVCPAFEADGLPVVLTKSAPISHLILDTSPTRKRGNTSAGVTCGTDLQWKIYRCASLACASG